MILSHYLELVQLEAYLCNVQNGNQLVQKTALKADWTLWTRKFLKADSLSFPKFDWYGMTKIEVSASKMIAGFSHRQVNKAGKIAKTPGGRKRR